MSTNREFNASHVTHQDPRTKVIQEMPKRSMFRKILEVLSYLHLFMVTVLSIFLTVRGILSTANDHRYRLRQWFLPVFASVGCGAIVALAWQEMITRSSAKAMKAIFWLSPLLSLGAGVLLICIGSKGGLAFGALALISAFIQSLYSCWVNPRIELATRVVSISVSSPPPGFAPMAILSILVSAIYACVAMAGVGGARAKRDRFDPLFIAVVLLSFIWTLQVIKNTLQATVARVKYTRIASGIEIDTGRAFLDTVGGSMGSICVTSIVLPILTVIRGSARAISQLSGDVDEFLFSCSGCSSGIASCLMPCGNRWGLVYLGVHNEGIMQASTRTWDMFRTAGMEHLINSDLTSSVCFLSGVAGGSLCSILAGTWTFLMHKSYATEVSIYAFLIGYLMCRVTMALPQASVSAYYVAYAENPQSQRFDNTIPDYIQRLQRYRT